MNLSSQIATLVRNLSDTDLCELALAHLSPELLNGTPTKAKAAPKVATPAVPGAPKKKVGRPAGSKNKPKATVAAAPVATPTAPADTAGEPVAAPTGEPAPTAPVAAPIAAPVAAPVDPTAALDAAAEDDDDDEQTEESLSLDIAMHVAKSATGVATSEIAAKYSIEKSLAAKILKQLVIAGKIFHGGEKRFSRYGRDQATADEASIQARGLVPAAE